VKSNNDTICIKYNTIEDGKVTTKKVRISGKKTNHKVGFSGDSVVIRGNSDRARRVAEAMVSSDLIKLPELVIQDIPGFVSDDDRELVNRLEQYRPANMTTGMTINIDDNKKRKHRFKLTDNDDTIEYYKEVIGNDPDNYAREFMVDDIFGRNEKFDGVSPQVDDHVPYTPTITDLGDMSSYYKDDGSAYVFEGNEDYLDVSNGVLRFNERVLSESMRDDNPILERLQFLSIAESNLDEFLRTKYVDSKSSSIRFVKRQTYMIENIYRQLMAEMKESYGIQILQVSQFRNDEKIYDQLESLFEEIRGMLHHTTVSDNVYMNYLESNKIYILNEVRPNSRILSESKTFKSIIEMPDIDRLICVPGQKSLFVLLDDLILEFANTLYEDAKIINQCPIRVLRAVSSVSYTDNERKYVDEVNRAISQRDTAKITIIDKSFNMTDLEETVIELEVNKFGRSHIINTQEDISSRVRLFVGGISFVNSLKNYIDSDKDMKFKSHKPRLPEDTNVSNIFLGISKRDTLIHMPYESFELSMLRFVNSAASDDQVMNIKIALYRVGNKDNPLIDALIKAIENGKLVSVMFELKAKFDEKNNVEAMNRLRVAGARLIFGPPEIKTHAKVCYVTRKENGHIELYSAISTGNFNPKTASIYEDYCLFTKDREGSRIGRDISRLFEFLGTNAGTPDFKHLIVSQFGIRADLYALIAKTMKYKDGSITIKCNALTDLDIIDKLYDASNAGVKINILCRGACCLRPGIPNMSENIKVKSIVGRFLEHSRVYKFNYFESDSDGNLHEKETIYIGSADLMPRNLDDRIEVLVPILDADIRKEIKREIKLYFKDNVNSYTLNPDGSYSNPTHKRKSKDSVDIHNTLVKKYKSLESIKLKGV
jgi:polyphosphate kinase